MDRGKVVAVLGALFAAPLLTGADCSGGTVGDFPAPTFQNAAKTVSVTVGTDPFSLVFKDASGRVLLESTPAQPARGVGEASANEVSSYAPLAITHDTNESRPGLIVGWDYFHGVDAPWHFAGRVSSIDAGTGR